MWLTWLFGQVRARRRWRARTDDGPRPAAGGVGSAGSGAKAKIAMSRHGRGLQGGRTGGRVQAIPSQSDGL